MRLTKPKAIIYILVITLILSPTTFGQTFIKCGDEIRVECKDDSHFEGNIQSFDNEKLSLQSGVTIIKNKDFKVNEIQSIYRIERKVNEYMFLGAMAGILASSALLATRGEGNSLNIGSGLLIGFAGVSTGATLGFFVGHNNKKVTEIDIIDIPLCGHKNRNEAITSIIFSKNF